jgi:hypothetical protein
MNIRTRLLAASTMIAAIAGGALAPAAIAESSAGATGIPTVICALHTVQPSILTPDNHNLTIIGTVTNTGDQPITNVQALPRFSRHRVASRADIHKVGTDATVNWGARYDAVFALVAQTLAPGQTRTFSLNIPTELLSFDEAGVYVVGVDIRGTAPNNDRVDLQTSRTVVPWIPDANELPPVPVAVLWPLAARPTLMPDNTLFNDSLAGQLDRGGPLLTLVNAGSDVPVTWTVDPDLLDTVQVLANGYRPAAPDESVHPSPADSSAAHRWKSAFDQATRDDEIRYLPYAVPDVDALLKTQPGLASDLSKQAVDAAKARRHSPTAGDVAWLDGSSDPEDLLATFAASGSTTVVVSGHSAVDDDDPVAQIDTAAPIGRVAVDGHNVDVVTTDFGLSDAMADAAAAADPQAGALDVKQRWIAETALVAMEAADANTDPVALVAAPPIWWQPDAPIASTVVDTWTSIPWVQPTQLSDIDKFEGRAGVLPEFTSPGATVLPTANVSATAQVAKQAAQYAVLLAEPDDTVAELGRMALRASSAAWRDDPTAGIAYTMSISNALTARFDKVTVTVPESVTLSSRAGSFPLTVTNKLPEPVNVRLDLQSANVDRLQVEDIPVERIEPGERRLITVTAQAAANGKVPVSVQLTTTDGVPLGPSRPTVVNATDYGTVGWIIVGTAAVLFAAAVIRRTGRRRSSPDLRPTPHLSDTDPTGPPGAVSQPSESVQEVSR